MDISKLKSKYLKAKKAYYAGKPIMTDSAFDKLEDLLKENEPKWSELGKTGITGKKTDKKLVKFMPSLNKVYPKDYPKWVAKNKPKELIIMEKLDGNSVQVVYKKGKLVSVLTRGDGETGGDISHLLPYFTLPKCIRNSISFVGRFEAIISRTNFLKHYSDTFDNARNMVAGLLNRKEPSSALAHVDFVGLGIYDMNLEVGVDLLDANGFKVVSHRIVRDYLKGGLNEKDLTKTLANRKVKSEYECDGLVLATQDFVLEYPKNEKPKAKIIAFKNNDEGTETTVREVIWQVSGNRRAIPKVRIDPIKLDGATLTYATAHNAKMAKDLGIGVGAKILVVRSGGVIPKIVGVTKPAKFEPPKFRTVWGTGNSQVHLISIDKANDKESAVDVMVRYMKRLGIENIAGSTISSMYDLGITSITKWYSTPDEKLAKLANSKTTEKGIHMLRSIKPTLETLADASGCFPPGIGRSRLEELRSNGYPMKKLMTMTPSEITSINIPIVKSKTLELVAKGMAEFCNFYKQISPYISLSKTATGKTKASAGTGFTWTGYRNKNEEAFIESIGGQVVPFGAKTAVLFYKEGGKQSTKVETAKEKGIPVTTFADYIKSGKLKGN